MWGLGKHNTLQSRRSGLGFSNSVRSGVAQASPSGGGIASLGWTYTCQQYESETRNEPAPRQKTKIQSEDVFWTAFRTPRTQNSSTKLEPRGWDTLSG